jgi:predicted metal-dependent HD superfamily phosphohydrolase
MANLSRWRDTWKGLGVEPPSDARYDALIACHREPHRHYHTVRHLEECFARLDDARGSAARVYEIELALWYHDAIYDTHAADNEARSADLAAEAAAEAGVPAAVIARLRDLILATRHDGVPDTQDAALLVDVDLAILGASPERFDEYEAQVGREYAWVPDRIFRTRRREILEGFLARRSIYATEHFRRACEAAARSNLARSIAALTR